MTHGTTNTWSVGKPTYDLEYADDTLLLGISTEVLEEYLRHLQVEASLYGLLFNLDKSELLVHHLHPPGPVHFADNTVVNTSTTVKYLGSQITWIKPTLTTITHGVSLATTAFNKLSHLWCSFLRVRAKVHIFTPNIVPIFLHGISALTMENKHFRRVHAWFFRYLRRAIGVKHSYYSHITNKEVWLRAHRPTLPSQQILASQFRLLLESLNADPADPFHHVSFGPAQKDRVSLHKHFKTGPPPPQWLSLTYSHAMEYYLQTVPKDKGYRMDIIGLQQYVQRYDPSLPARLLPAPTRHPSHFNLCSPTIGSAWQP